MKKIKVQDVLGLDDDGNLRVNFEEVEDGKPEPTPEQKAEQQRKFDGGDPQKAYERYKALQGWATKVRQENIELQQRIAQIQNQLSQLMGERNSVPKVKLPSADDPGHANLEDILSDGSKFEDYVRSVVASQLKVVGDYVDERLSKFQPVLDAYNTHQELLDVVNRHPDFPKWQQEMLEVSRSLPENETYTLEQIYLLARQRHPEKAEKLDLGLSDESEGENKNVAPNNDNPTDDKSTGTVSRTPETTTQSASPAEVVLPVRSNTSGMYSSYEQRGATADELKALADRNTTETGVADGTSPAIARSNSIRTSIEAALEQLSSGS